MYQDDEIGYSVEENNNIDIGDNFIDDDYDNDNNYSNNKKSNKLIVTIVVILAVVFIIILFSLFSSCSRDEIVPNINILQDKVYLKINTFSNLPLELVNAENTNINWQTDNEDIVTVDQSGNIGGIKLGNSNVIATYVDSNYKKYSDQCEVIVHDGDIDVPLNDIIGLDDIKIKKGDVYNLSLKFSPSNAYIYNIKYDIVDNNIATVNDSGIITANGVGATKLNIIVNEEINKNINVEVVENMDNSNINDKPTAVNFSKKQIDLMVNTDTKLSYSVVPDTVKSYNVSFENSNNTVLHVDDDGNVKGISVGTSTVTIKINDTITDSIVINVKPFVVNVSQIVLQSSNNISLNIGDTSIIRYNIIPLNASNKMVSFTSSDENVASVDVNGRINAIGSGMCVIVVKTEDESKSLKISVTVN